MSMDHSGIINTIVKRGFEGRLDMSSPDSIVFDLAALESDVLTGGLNSAIASWDRKSLGNAVHSLKAAGCDKIAARLLLILDALDSINYYNKQNKVQQIEGSEIALMTSALESQIQDGDIGLILDTFIERSYR